MANRRSVLIGLGGLVAGGGAILSTGAFDTVEAERTVSVETTGDANALLGLTPVDDDGPYVDDSGETIEITLGSGEDENGLNRNAVTTFDELVTIANNSEQDVDVLSFAIDVTGLDDDDDEEDHEEAFSIVVNETTYDADDDADSTNVLDDQSDLDLDSGNSLNFGVEIDLRNGDISAIDGDAEFTLTITAETTESS
ncbi:hypothetical protein [Halorubrum sp. BV1]|uniref:hypothetical protein n=1 Tax=Halorubrum sp. BV1 TaxID=1498500 RepID=UPI000679ABDC|nr:hypothetical protein [Halorubrum sp. BV1]